MCDRSRASLLHLMQAEKYGRGTPLLGWKKLVRETTSAPPSHRNILAVYRPACEFTDPDNAPPRVTARVGAGGPRLRSRFPWPPSTTKTTKGLASSSGKIKSWSKNANDTQDAAWDGMPIAVCVVRVLVLERYTREALHQTIVPPYYGALSLE
jgi:hypothetical protein